MPGGGGGGGGWLAGLGSHVLALHHEEEERGRAGQVREALADVCPRSQSGRRSRGGSSRDEGTKHKNRFFIGQECAWGRSGGGFPHPQKRPRQTNRALWVRVTPTPGGKRLPCPRGRGDNFEPAAAAPERPQPTVQLAKGKRRVSGSRVTAVQSGCSGSVRGGRRRLSLPLPVPGSVSLWVALG